MIFLPRCLFPVVFLISFIIETLREEQQQILNSFFPFHYGSAAVFFGRAQILASIA